MESIPQTRKNKKISSYCILSYSGCSEPKPNRFSEILLTTFTIYNLLKLLNSITHSYRTQINRCLSV